MKVEHEPERLDVVILGFDSEGEEHALQGLRRVFNMDEARARLLLAKLPNTVARGVPEVRARYLRRALRMVDAQVEIRDAGGVVVELADDPAPVPQPPPPRRRPLPASQPAPLPGLLDPAEAKSGATGARAALGVAVTERPPALGDDVAAAPPQEFAPPLDAPPLDAPPAAPAPAPQAKSSDTLIMATQPMREVLAVAQGTARTNPTVPEGVPAAATAPRTPSDAEDTPSTDAPDWSNFGTRDPSYIQGAGFGGLREPSYIDESPAPFVRDDDRPQYAAGPRAPSPPPTAEAAPAPAATDALRPGTPTAIGAALTRGADGNFEAPTSDRAPALELAGRRADGQRGTPWTAAHDPTLVAGGEADGESAQPRAHAAGPATQPDPFAPDPPGSRRSGEALSLPPGDARDGRDRPALAGYDHPSKDSIDGYRHPAQRHRKAPAGPGGRPRAAGEVRARQVEVPRSFWETLGEALILPFTGTGTAWVVTITLWAAALGALSAFLDMLPDMVASAAGIALPLLSLGTCLAFAADYHRVCVWTVLSRRAEPRESPELGNVMGEYLGAGLQLLLFGAVGYLPLIALGLSHDWQSPGALQAFAGSPLTLALIALPHLYFPMALATAALGNRVSAIWAIGFGLRAIMGAPFEYLFVVFVSGCATACAGGALVVAGVQLGLGDPFLLGGLGLPLAIGCGLQGGLMGYLMRAEPDAFS